MSVEDGEWMSWAEARDRVEEAGLSTAGKLPLILLDWAQSGLVKCRAAALMINDSSEIDASIPPLAWKIARAGQNGRIDWATGYVQCRINLQLGQKAVILKAHGTEFSRNEIDRLAPPLSGQSAANQLIIDVDCARTEAEARVMGANFGPDRDQDRESPNRGGRKLSAKWPEFVAELCEYLHENGYPAGSGTEGAEELMSAVFDRLVERGAEDTMSRAAAQPAVNAVLRRNRASN